MVDLCPGALWGEEISDAHVKHDLAPEFSYLS